MSRANLCTVTARHGSVLSALEHNDEAPISLSIAAANCAQQANENSKNEGEHMPKTSSRASSKHASYLVAAHNDRIFGFAVDVAVDAVLVLARRHQLVNLLRSPDTETREQVGE